MKNITLTIIAAATLVSSTLAFAGPATEISRMDAASLNQTGVISASGFTTLDGLQASLAMKASEAGANHYRIVSASGNNKLSGTAILYR
ncbi:YdgH/BhsA/McbA-like domain containing protein [Scandinavium sp. NPDC088450]|uniref:YdgH/BhsA/McbA-like domain containing protein n=1 Tax=Scandinavium sp. NPDC088450 TaxID=3364514 RepID=UPI00384A9E4F